MPPGATGTLPHPTLTRLPSTSNEGSRSRFYSCITVTRLPTHTRPPCQLMHLASQFHASDYCRAKFGARGTYFRTRASSKRANEISIGSALTYIPLSIHLPDHFRELQTRQALYAQDEAWWLCDRDMASAKAQLLSADRVVSTRTSTVTHVETTGSVTVTTRISIDLQQELSCAIETSMWPPEPLLNGEPALKTSETHPIK